MRTALVLSGGGARGAFEVGAIRRLIDDGVNFDVISGVSVGATNAAVLAQGEASSTVDHLEKIWRDIRGDRDIFSRRWPGSWAFEEINLAFRDSIYSLDPLRQLLESHISPQELDDSNRELRIGVVNLQKGELVVANQHSPNLISWVLASASIPVIFPPVKIMGEYYGDGGVADVAPMSSAFDALRNMEAEKAQIYVVLTQPLYMPRASQSDLRNGVSVLKRTVELLTSEVLRNDIKMADLHNQLAHEESISADIHVIAPEEPPMGTLDFSPRSIDDAIRLGYEKAL